MVLHGTGGDGKQFLRPQFADELYGPGQPLDIRQYFIILPDNIGHGQSSKPSDGLRMHFPKYDYDDMVEAQRAHALAMGVTHLRLIMGTSMGCMHSFMWGEPYPNFARALMPLACEPIEIAGSTGCGASSRSTGSPPIRRGTAAITKRTGDRLAGRRESAVRRGGGAALLPGAISDPGERERLCRGQGCERHHGAGRQ